MLRMTLLCLVLAGCVETPTGPSGGMPAPIPCGEAYTLPYMGGGLTEYYQRTCIWPQDSTGGAK